MNERPLEPDNESVEPEAWAAIAAWEADRADKAESELKELKGTDCRWWQSHVFSKWETIRTGTVSHGWPAKIQERVCLRCGRLEIRAAKCCS